MAIWEQIKAAFQGYLERVAQENQKQFGNETPDCCKLNQRQNPGAGQQKK